MIVSGIPRYLENLIFGENGQPLYLEYDGAVQLMQNDWVERSSFYLKKKKHGFLQWDSNICC